MYGSGWYVRRRKIHHTTQVVLLLGRQVSAWRGSWKGSGLVLEVIPENMCLLFLPLFFLFNISSHCHCPIPSRSFFALLELFAHHSSLRRNQR